MKSLIRRGIKDKRGQSTVEFALILPILLLIVFGIIEFGLIFNAYVTVISSSREGARYGIIGDKDEAQIIQKVKDTAGILDLSKLNVNVQKTNSELTVNVIYQADVLDPIMGGILGKSIPLRAKTTMAME